MSAQAASFTRQGAFAGARGILPIAASGIVFDVIVGMLARQAGFTVVETLLLHALVFAGTAQLAALALWATPLPIVAILVSTAIVNSRYLLMGAAIHPWMARLPLHKVYGTLFFLTDETWALTQNEFGGGKGDVGYLFGSGLFLWLVGFAGVLLGYSAGALIQDPAQWGLDFLFTAILIALLVTIWKGSESALPWIVAALVAIACSLLLPGNGYIVAGALAGSIVGALRDAR
jgi:4-azaleucine resistance transporter AzlC